MRDEIHVRVIDEADYIIETGATVRSCAKKFDISKSTVHKDMRKRLPLIDKSLALAVGRVLDKNMSERHIRGGEATRIRFLTQRAAE